MMGGGTNVATFYFTGNASGVSNAVNQANNSLATLEKAAARNWWGIRNLGIAFAALPGLVGAGTAAAIRSATQWEDAMAGVARTNFDTSKSVDENNASMQKLSGQLFQIAQNIPQSALTLAQIAESAGALGVAQQDVASFTETVANLTAVTDLTADKAATDLARIAGLLGITSAGYDNLASSITGTGVATAATESDITSIATKISGVAGVVGLTADQVIGLSAAVRSAGVSAIEGGTQVQKSLIDITNAVHNGGKALKNWSALAGLGQEEFRQAFGNDPAQLIVTLVQHMSDLEKSGGNVIGMLNDAGVTEQRQVRTLLLLAQAQGQNVNENLKLSHILDVSAGSFANTAAYAEMLRRRYDTVAGQLQILRNIIFQSAVSFGNIFLPAVKATIGVLSAMINGFAAMPGPVKAMIAIVIGLGTALSGIAAAALLVGPRILIAMGAVSQLQTNLLKTAAASGELTVGMENVSRAQLRAAGATGAFIRTLNMEERQMLATSLASGNLGNVQALTAAKGFTMGEAGFAMSGALATATSWMGKLAKGALWVGIVITALSAIMAFFGKNTAKVAEEQAKLMVAQPKLVDALRNQKKGAADAGVEWLKTSKRYAQASRATKELHINHDQLLQLIRGGGGSEEMAKNLDTIKKSMDGGNESARKAYNNIRILQGQYQNSAAEAGVFTGQNQGLGDSLGDVAGDAKEAKKALQELHDTMEAEASAAGDYADAIMSQAQANFNLKDAEIALEEAQYKAANTADRLAEAERTVVEAKIDQQKASEDLIDAERDLETAQVDARNNVLDLEDQLADAHDKYLDTLTKITDDEEALEKIRKGSSLKEILKLTNDLRQAQLNLTKATLGVQDAEWQLNFLREEGASNRDILDAQNTLEQSKIDLTDATEAQADAEQKLADASDPVKQAQELSKAERQLASDRREAEKALRDITSLEHDLANAREDLASNRAVIDAQNAVQKAHDAVAEAAQRTKDAEHALDVERRNDTAAMDLAKATQNYQQALLDLAKVNTDVIKQQALMNGETWDAGRNAHTLAEELGKVLENTPKGADIGHLREFMGILSKAPDVPEVPDDWGDDLADGVGSAVDEAFPDGIQIPLGPPKIDVKEAAKSLKERVKAVLKAALIGLGAIAAGLVAAALLPEGAAAGALAAGIAALAGFLIKKFLETGIGKALINGIVDLGGWAEDRLEDFGGWIYDHIVAPIKRLFGIDSPSKVMIQIAHDIIDGLIQGVKEKLSEILATIGALIQNIKEKFSGAGGWLVDKGSDLIHGLWQGVQNAKDWFLGLVGGIFGWVTDKIGNTASWLLEKGKGIIQGLWNGLYSLKDWFVDAIGKIPGWIIDKLSGVAGLANRLFGAGVNMIEGLWNGIKDKSGWLLDKIGGLAGDIVHAFTHPWELLSPSKVMHRIGEYLIMGLGNGIEQQTAQKLLPAIGTVAANVNEEMTKQLDISARKFGPFGISDFATSRDAMALSGGHAAATAAAGGVTNNYYEHFDLDLETNADPEKIVNEYVWQKRIRTRR